LNVAEGFLLAAEHAGYAALEETKSVGVDAAEAVFLVMGAVAGSSGPETGDGGETYLGRSASAACTHGVS